MASTLQVLTTETRVRISAVSYPTLHGETGSITFVHPPAPGKPQLYEVSLDRLLPGDAVRPWALFDFELTVLSIATSN